MLKLIGGYENYYISEEGQVFKKTKNGLHKMKSWTDSRGLYVQVGLSNKGKKNYLVHRLVAIAYLDNPDNLPEVNHKDKNTQNNHLSNLEWVDRKENLRQSYETMSPVRNFIECIIYQNGQLLHICKSKEEACRFVSENYGVSYASLKRYGKSKGFLLVERSNDYPSSGSRVG